MNESFEIGINAELQLKNILLGMGWEIEDADEQSDMKEHWDFKVREAHVWTKIDVKASKKINRDDPNVDYKWLWIELENVKGGRCSGWLFGNADVIAFELEKEFILVDRKALASRTMELINTDATVGVDTAKEAKYESYRRNGLDLITLIEVSKIEDLIMTRISK